MTKVEETKHDVKKIAWQENSSSGVFFSDKIVVHYTKYICLKKFHTATKKSVNKKDSVTITYSAELPFGIPAHRGNFNSLSFFTSPCKDDDVAKAMFETFELRFNGNSEKNFLE